MFWRIVRPRYWIADRRLRQLDRRVVIVLIALLSLGGQWVYDWLAPQIATLTANTAVSLLVANMLLSGVYLFLLVGLLGADDLLQQLFFSPELELLCVAPIAQRTLFAVKLWQGSRVILWPALAYAAVLIGFGAAHALPWPYYPLVLTLVLGLALLVTAVLLTLVLLLARRLPPRRAQARLPLGLALLPALLALSYNPLMGWLMGHTTWLDGIVQTWQQPLHLMPLVGGVFVMALFAVGIAYRTFATSFLLGWNQLQSVPVVEKGRVERETAVSSSHRSPARWLPTPLRYFAPKEWLLLRRSPLRITNLLTSFLPIILILLPLLISERRSDPQWQPFFFWMLLVLSLTFAYITILNETLPALSREGRRLALLRLAPLATAVWLRHKFWGLPWPLSLLVWALLLTLLALLWRLAAWQVSVIAATLGWTLLLAATLFYSLGALFGPLTAANDDAKAQGGATVLALVGYVLLALLTLATAIWLLAQWQPQSSIVAMIRPFAQSGVLHGLFTASTTMGWVLLGGQGTAVALIYATWQLARRRLARWEEG